MAPPASAKQARNRRRKKRRTEDFSSDSDSSSLSDDEQPLAAEPEPELDPAVNIDDMDIASDTEQGEELDKDTRRQLDGVTFTATENQPLAEAKETVKQDRQHLESAYLAYMADKFSEDLDQLRKKPDFTDRSIVLLAKTLQLGSNMFDEDTLEAVLN